MSTAVEHPFFTVGHSTRSLDELFALLRAADVEWVADIRSIPRSRTNPQFNRETLPDALSAAGFGYEHEEALGGRRGRSRTVPATMNDFWTHPSFHNYADYALSDAFRAGLDRFVERGHERRAAMMCSEAVWWRCHRRIVADHLIARGEVVFHIMGAGLVSPASLTPGAVIRDDRTVVYPKVG